MSSARERRRYHSSSNGTGIFALCTHYNKLDLSKLVQQSSEGRAMNKIQAQAAKVGKILFNTETWVIYKKAITLSWNLLGELARLIWLIICLGIFVVAWLWTNSIQAAQELQSWYASIEEPKTDNVLNAAGKELLLAGTTGAALALTHAKSQLGIEEEPETIEVQAIASQVTQLPTQHNQNVSTPPVAKISTQTQEDV
ncbi:MAG: hypothetical protein F6K14_16430 [Symploca sp. SIO2C1]|nr:hypothetical protein [Symploca sp. SIO2C1]